MDRDTISEIIQDAYRDRNPNEQHSGANIIDFSDQAADLIIQHVTTPPLVKVNRYPNQVHWLSLTLNDKKITIEKMQLPGYYKGVLPQSLAGQTFNLTFTHAVIVNDQYAVFI